MHCCYVGVHMNLLAESIAAELTFEWSLLVVHYPNMFVKHS